jgi:hypothetical protein
MTAKVFFYFYSRRGLRHPDLSRTKHEVAGGQTGEKILYQSESIKKREKY